MENETLTNSRVVNRLYAQAMKKMIVSSSDFATIDRSKGNIAVVDNLSETLVFAESLVKGADDSYRNLPTPSITFNNISRSGTSLEKMKREISSIRTAYNTVLGLSQLYTTGFARDTKYVIMEYDAIATLIVRALNLFLGANFVIGDTTADGKLQVFVMPKASGYKKYMKYLEKYNKTTLSSKYKEYINSFIDGTDDDRVVSESVILSTAVGVVTIVAIALILISIIRKLIYVSYQSNAKMARFFEQQALYVEIRKALLEASTTANPDTKKKILSKMEARIRLLNNLSERLRVGDIEDQNKASSEIKKDDKLVSLDVGINVDTTSEDAHIELL